LIGPQEGNVITGIGQLLSRSGKQTPTRDENDSATTGSEHDAIIPGVTTEHRDGRVHVWIDPQFTVLARGDTHKGVALSLQGLEIENGAPLSRTNQAAPMQLRLEIGTFVLELSVKAKYQTEGNRDGKTTSIYEFVNLAGGTKEALRRYIRAHLTGHILSVDDLVRSQDSPTGVRGANARGLRAQRRNNNFIARTVRTLFNLAVALTALVVIFGFGGALVLERLTIVHGAFASVTAPSVEMSAPVGGQVLVAGPRAGASVSVGSELAQMPDSRTVFRSPCDCIVTFAVEDSSWVRRGDPIYRLARNSPDALRVEMLVPLTQMNRIHRGQAAYILWPETGETIQGTIEVITLEGTAEPRTGFPNSLREDNRFASVIIATNSPMDPAMIGQPINAYVRTNVTFLERIARFVGGMTVTDNSAEALEASGGSNQETLTQPVQRPTP